MKPPDGHRIQRPHEACRTLSASLKPLYIFSHRCVATASRAECNCSCEAGGKDGISQSTGRQIRGGEKYLFAVCSCQSQCTHRRYEFRILFNAKHAENICNNDLLFNGAMTGPSLDGRRRQCAFYLRGLGLDALLIGVHGRGAAVQSVEHKAGVRFDCCLRLALFEVCARVMR